MGSRKLFVAFAFCMAIFSLGLFSQITFEGVVTDNGAEFLGNGAKPIANALVELTDQADPGRYFRDYTDKEGRYVIQITETGTDDVRPGIPSLFKLSQNYPNPFNPSTVIAYEITHPADIRITVHDILGRKIKTLFDGFHSGLSGRIVWKATDDAGRGVPAGIYIYSLNVEGIRINKKMLLMDGCRSGSTLSLSKPAQTGKALDKKMSDQYRLRVTGPDIEIHEQQNLQITGNTVLGVAVFRTVTDIDGHVYRTVKIGDQWWMAENLKVTHYRNGEAIPNVTDKTAWSTLTTGAYCEYDNDSFNSSSYGYLYNWYAVNDNRGVAPIGWHVPGDAEWQILVDCLGGNAVAGGKMKETGTVHWTSPNTSATNESGFSAVPGGCRDKGGTFSDMGCCAHVWSSTENGSNNAWYYGLNYSDSDVYRGDDSQLDGFSIRCVRGFGTIATPTFSPSPGTYPTAQTITVSCSTSGATIHYTTNGVDPKESDSTTSSPVSIASTATLKARAYKIGWNPSDVDSGTYTITSTVATPMFSPSPGTYPTAQKITISCSTSGATIHYTTNGADSKESNATYSSPVFISYTTTLKARAYKSGWNPSGLAGGKYTMNTSTIYCMGNSITAAGKYERYLNDLLGVSWGVVNLGISGQTTAQMLARFTQDVIMPGDAEYVIVLGGVNDVRFNRTAQQIELNLQSMYTAAHNAGIKVVAVSILPFKNFKGNWSWTAEKQVVLDDVNAWISKTAVHVDYKVNAYKALEDPVNPDYLLPAYDSSDGLHPSYAGHNALANVICNAVSWTH